MIRPLPNWVEHNEARMRELLRTNHAGVVEWPCRGGCGRMFDVGYERLIHPAFNPCASTAMRAEDDPL